jgi:hypothetical protein
MGYDVTIYRLLIYFKKVDDSVRKEVLYNILIDLSVPITVFKLTVSKMCQS